MNRKPMRNHSLYSMATHRSALRTTNGRKQLASPKTYVFADICV